MPHRQLITLSAERRAAAGAVYGKPTAAATDQALLDALTLCLEISGTEEDRGANRHAVSRILRELETRHGEKEED